MTEFRLACPTFFYILGLTKEMWIYINETQLYKDPLFAWGKIKDTFKQGKTEIGLKNEYVLEDGYTIQ